MSKVSKGEESNKKKVKREYKKQWEEQINK